MATRFRTRNRRWTPGDFYTRRSLVGGVFFYRLSAQTPLPALGGSAPNPMRGEPLVRFCGTCPFSDMFSACLKLRRFFFQAYKIPSGAM